MILRCMVDASGAFSMKEAFGRLIFISLVCSTKCCDKSVQCERTNSNYIFPGARSDTIVELQEALITHCAKELNLKLYPVDDYHISLTRTVVLRHHWIQMFMTSIKSNLEVCEKSTCILDCIRIYNNDEKTRSFIGISVAKEDEPKLMQIIQRLDLCLAEFNLEKFYEVRWTNLVFVSESVKDKIFLQFKNPSFHISLLWCTYSEELQNCVKKFNDILESILIDNEDNSDVILKLDVIHGKCGNKVFIFPL